MWTKLSSCPRCGGTAPQSTRAGSVPWGEGSGVSCGVSCGISCGIHLQDQLWGSAVGSACRISCRTSCGISCGISCGVTLQEPAPLSSCSCPARGFSSPNPLQFANIFKRQGITGLSVKSLCLGCSDTVCEPPWLFPPVTVWRVWLFLMFSGNFVFIKKKLM